MSEALSSPRLRVLVVGCGHMGLSHARAYRAMADDFEIVGLVSRGEASRGKVNADLGGGIPEYSDYSYALRQTRPDAVCISTYPDTHAPYALAALEAGAHVFLEKPLATSRPVMNSSKRSVMAGLVSEARASGDTSTG